MKLEGKVAFVTGASRVIGAAIARALSSEGVAVGLASRSGHDLVLPSALGLTCDVRGVQQVEDAVARTVEPHAPTRPSDPRDGSAPGHGAVMGLAV
jgi:NAD(P)-dependent dehydrogenase (short-subunit alcohol dehydrogenase family)